MTIYIASDHAGFELKKKIKDFLVSKEYEVVDCGPEVFDPMDDYPDFVSRVAENVAREEGSKGIIVGMSGQGEAMVANRFKRVRATAYYGGPDEIITLSRHHNNANILSLGAHFLSYEQAVHAINLWLSIAFSGEERHMRRILKIDQEG